RVYRVPAREGEKAMGQGGGAIGRSQGAGEEPADIGAPPAGDAPLNDVQTSYDTLQEIVEIMRDAAGELADGLHFLALPQRFLGLHELARSLRHARLERRIEVGQH